MEFSWLKENDTKCKLDLPKKGAGGRKNDKLILLRDNCLR